MKTKIIFFALFICICAFAQSDLEQLQLQYNQATKYYQKISKKDSIKIVKLQAKHNQLLAKRSQKEQELETSKPMKAKNLNKQIEKLSVDISKLEDQLDKYISEIEKAHARKDSLLLEINKLQGNSSEEISIADSIDENAELSEHVEFEDSLEQAEIYARDSIDESGKEKNAPSKSTEDDDSIGTVLFALIVIILFVIVSRLITERCPYCGKKGTLISLGDSRKYQYDAKGNVTRTGVLKRYKCSHCGRTVVRLKWG